MIVLFIIYAIELQQSENLHNHLSTDLNLFEYDSIEKMVIKTIIISSFLTTPFSFILFQCNIDVSNKKGSTFVIRSYRFIRAEKNVINKNGMEKNALLE
jgi:hypothetical protein